jgi:hypothetical protein
VRGNHRSRSRFRSNVAFIAVNQQRKKKFIYEDYEISPQFRSQIGDGYDFFASVRDGVSIQHAFRLTNLVLVVAAKAPYYPIGPPCGLPGIE